MIAATKDNAPLVSVAITAFNLESLLPRTIEGALMQQVDFPVEIVIGDDCSQDSSAEIAKSFQARYPDRIRVFQQSGNVGVQRNTFDTWQRCRGKYIAWLDGDDRWTDPMKLSLQVNAMEADASISMSCHFVRYVSSDGVVKKEKAPSVPPGRYKLNDIIKSNFAQSPSVMFRNGLQRGLPEWYFQLKSLSDWPLHIVSAMSGDILLLDRIMADYTLHPNSSFTSKGQLFWEQTNVSFYEHVEGLVPEQWRRLVRREKGRHYETIAYLLRGQGKFAESRRAAWKAFSAPSLVDNLGSKTRALIAALARAAEAKFKK